MNKKNNLPDQWSPDDILDDTYERHPVERKMLELLVCPLTRTTLQYNAKTQELISHAARLAFPIRNGIPIMLPEEARILEN